MKTFKMLEERLGRRTAMNTLRYSVALCCLLILFAVVAQADDPYSERERVIELWMEGKHVEGREACRIWLAKSLESLGRSIESAQEYVRNNRSRALAAARTPEAKTRVRNRMSKHWELCQVTSIVLTDIIVAKGWLETWESQEIRVKLETGKAIPQMAYDAAAKAAKSLNEVFTQLEYLVSDTDLDSCRGGRASNSSYRGLGEALTESLDRTAVFLEDNPEVTQRQQILEMANRRRAVPVTLQELDDQARDLRALFRLMPAGSSSRVELRPPGQRFHEADHNTDPEIFAFLDLYYERLFSGDLKQLRPMVIPEIWSEAEVRESAKFWSGWRVVSYDRVLIRNLADGRVEVRLEEMTLAGLDGRTSESFNVFILRRTADGFIVEQH